MEKLARDVYYRKQQHLFFPELFQYTSKNQTQKAAGFVKEVLMITILNFWIAVFPVGNLWAGLMIFAISTGKLTISIQETS